MNAITENAKMPAWNSISTNEKPTNEKTKNSIMIAINAFFLTDFIFTSFFTLY
ncbi:MAG: hypothetical protein IJP90_01675 [Treponema sp.]|nr:hypothetical protein [Treponema sp.]